MHSNLIKNKIEVVILRHPQEQDLLLGTAPLIQKTLSKVTITTGLSWPNSEAALGKKVDNKKWLVLYLGSAKVKSKKILSFVDKKGIEIENDSAVRRSIEGIVVLDGTWSQAKALWWRNAWLLKLNRAVINPFMPSLYGKLRKEPRRESVSTIEAVAATLAELGEPISTSKALLAGFRAMLDTHRNKK